MLDVDGVAHKHGHDIPGDDPWNAGSCGSSEKGEARAIVGHLDFTPTN